MKVATELSQPGQRNPEKKPKINQKYTRGILAHAP